MESSYELHKSVENPMTMEERLRKAHEDTMESLKVLRDKLRTGGALNEQDSANVRPPSSETRTPLEGAVSAVEDHGWMIRDLTNEIVI